MFGDFDVLGLLVDQCEGQTELCEGQTVPSHSTV